MKSITYTATVNRDHKATIDLPNDIAPGVYTLRVYVEEKSAQAAESPLQGLSTVCAWDRLRDISLRREDIYGDGGR